MPGSSPGMTIQENHQLTETYCVSRNSISPSCAPSRPMPLCFMPPNGAAGSETRPRLSPTMPGAVRRLAAGENFCAFADGIVDELYHLLLCIRIDQRADRDAVVEPVADLQAGHLGGEFLGELVVHLLLHVEAVRRGAGLAHV